MARDDKSKVVTRGKLLGALVATDEFPDACSEGTAHERTHYEDPKLIKSVTSGEQGGTNRTSRVHTGARVVDTHQVDEDERQADGQTSEVVGGAIGFAGCAQHHEHENHGEQDFGKQSLCQCDRSASIAKFLQSISAQSAIAASKSAQSASSDDGSDNKNTFFAVCWVMVLAPRSRPPRMASSRAL